MSFIPANKVFRMLKFDEKFKRFAHLHKELTIYSTRNPDASITELVMVAIFVDYGGNIDELR